MKKMEGFKNTVFECKDYDNLNPRDMLIYCDPPYFGTTQYSRQVVGDFDHNRFWGVVRKWSSNNVVMVSEYIAPKDFDCIWEKATKLDIRDKNNNKLNRVEKIFTVNKNIEFNKGFNRPLLLSLGRGS